MIGYRKKAEDNTRLFFEMDSERGMFSKSLFLNEVYNVTNIDEIFETHIKKFLNAANMDLEENRFEPEHDNYRHINFYNLEDDRYSGSVVVSFNGESVTISYNMFMREKTKR